MSLIAALDTEGCVWFSLTQANTDQNVILLFLQHLIHRLDEDTPGWKQETYILLDGARYHTGTEIREFLHKMQLRVVFSGPYSYSTAPIELLFGGLKFGDLNPDKLPTEKRVIKAIYILIP